METNNISNSEFEQMRSQLEIMKRKLDQQEIVSDRLVRQAMKQKMSWIKKFIWVELLVLYPFIILSLGVFTAIYGQAWGVYAAIIALTGLDIYADFKINRTGPGDWLTENLVETSRKLVRMKRLRMWQVIISVPLIIVFMVLYFHRIGQHMPHELFVSMSYGGVFGFSIGLCIGLRILFKMQRTNDELISQIEEITMRKD